MDCNKKEDIFTGCGCLEYDFTTTTTTVGEPIIPTTTTTTTSKPLLTGEVEFINYTNYTAWTLVMDELPNAISFDYIHLSLPNSSDSRFYTFAPHISALEFFLNFVNTTIWTPSVTVKVTVDGNVIISNDYIGYTTPLSFQQLLPFNKILVEILPYKPPTTTTTTTTTTTSTTTTTTTTTTLTTTTTTEPSRDLVIQLHNNSDALLTLKSFSAKGQSAPGWYVQTNIAGQGINVTTVQYTGTMDDPTQTRVVTILTPTSPFTGGILDYYWSYDNGVTWVLLASTTLPGPLYDDDIILNTLPSLTNILKVSVTQI